MRLGLVNYARPFIHNLSALVGPLYSKLRINGVKVFNREDLLQIEKIKQYVKNLPLLRLPLDTDYLILETDGNISGWGSVLKRKPNKYSPRSSEKICRYNSVSFREKNVISSIDQEILAVIYGLDANRLFLLNKSMRYYIWVDDYPYTLEELVISALLEEYGDTNFYY